MEGRRGSGTPTRATPTSGGASGRGGSQPRRGGPTSSSSPSSRASPRLAALKAAKREEMMKKKQQEGSPLAVEIRDPFQAAIDSKAVVRGSTALVYDEAMLGHSNPWDPGHIECPERLSASLDRCRELGLLDRCARIPARSASDQEILLAHSPEHLRSIEDTTALPVEQIKSRCLRQMDNSVYMNDKSLDCTRMATAAAVDVATAVFDRQAQNGLALVRPPGHHAGRDEVVGFCLTNHVAVAARHLMRNKGTKRIMVVDFDVHHGQATQREFYDDPSLLYISMHRFDHGRYWPHLRESDYDHVGRDEGVGFNVNVPINDVGLTDSDYLAIFHQLVLPLGYEFSPEIVLVSAGFDAAIGCPEGEMNLSPMVYGHLVSSLMSLAGGKVVAVLEGGYFVESLSEGVAMTLRALLGDPCFTLGPLSSSPVRESTVTSLLNTLSAVRSHWRSLQLQDDYPISTYDATTDRDCHEPTFHGFEGEKYAAARLDNMEAYDPKHFYSRHTEERRKALLEELDRMKRTYLHRLASPGSRKKVALVYDVMMTKHANLDDPGHPERPQRVSRIMSTLEDFGLTARPALMSIDSRRATREEICLVHREEHFDEMATVPTVNQRVRNDMADKFDSIYFNADSFDSALLSCGSLLNVVDCVCSGDSLRGAAVIRPPGHHAEADEACGFCLFNNVAVAAKYAIENHDVKRVLILDWDVHHGNGIQNMFYNDRRVLYVSLHRFDHGTFFPGREDANYTFVGDGDGEGFNVNVPWNGPGMGDAEYLFAFFNVVLPVAYEFDPELVLVSAGFDAARGDPLGNCKVSPEMYGHMTHHLAALANGRVVVALEGGYNLNSISLSMSMCVKALLGDPLPAVDYSGEPKPGAVDSVRRVAAEHARFWSCLRFGARLPDLFEDLRAHVVGEATEGAEAAEVAVAAAAAAEVSPRESPLRENSSYVPSEYGRYATTAYINTMSTANRHFETKETAAPKKESAGGKGASSSSAALSEPLAAMKLNEEKLKLSSASSYVPSEYGPTHFGSPYVNTSTTSWHPAECMLTNAPAAPAANRRDAAAAGKEDGDAAAEN